MLRRLFLFLLKRAPKWLQGELILRQLYVPPHKLSPHYTVKIADKPEEHDAAARVTFNAYSDRGILTRGGVPVRITPFLLMPTTIKFVALYDGVVVGTLALIIDSSIGLPMESIFQQEIAERRKQGRLMAEVGALAIDRKHRRSGLVMLMYKAMWQTATQLGVHDLVMSCNPNAESIYTTVLCFERLTNRITHYPGMVNALAVGMLGDLKRVVEEMTRTFNRPMGRRFNPYQFFAQTQHPQLHIDTSPAALERSRATHLAASLRLAALRPDIFSEMDDDKLHRIAAELAAIQPRPSRPQP